MKGNGVIAILSLIPLLFINFSRMTSTQITLFTPDNKNIQYTGRIDFSDPQKPRLSGAGSYYRLKFRGKDCSVLLEDQNLYNNHNYFSIVLDDEYQGRIKVHKDKATYQIAKDLKDTVHTILVCKATEAQIGYTYFLGISCEGILPLEKIRKRKIEFIGNSITCGTGLDATDIPCDSAEWYDQHNAYLAYGPIVARELKADWLLSSVSGIGMIRNWNSPGPTMPEVYFNTYLDTDSTSLWDAQNFIPDLISVYLGTNDFSDGDGSYERGVLDSARFINDYIQFLKNIRLRYPQAPICCLTSPVLSCKKSAQLKKYLITIIEHMQKIEKDNNIHMFIFSRSYNNGCTGHPNKEEHQMMAEELLSFFKRVMDWE